MLSLSKPPPRTSLPSPRLPLLFSPPPLLFFPLGSWPFPFQSEFLLLLRSGDRSRLRVALLDLRPASLSSGTGMPLHPLNRPVPPPRPCVPHPALLHSSPSPHTLYSFLTLYSHSFTIATQPLPHCHKPFSFPQPRLTTPTPSLHTQAPSLKPLHSSLTIHSSLPHPHHTLPRLAQSEVGMLKEATFTDCSLASPSTNYWYWATLLFVSGGFCYFQTEIIPPKIQNY